jgi:uncharacterized protein (DUF2249 family)
VIRASDKVDAVLAREERLVDVLIEISPVFGKLRNPVLRRTMARLVTVEQAARIGGVDAAMVVRRLNEALGIHDSEESVVPAAPPHAEAVPEFLRAYPAERLVDVDVRDDLRAGREPFRRIMDAARATPVGHVLRVRATFEPAPLYAVFAKRGWAHATERLADDDWRVWFHCEATADAAPAEAAPVSNPEGDVVVLDVRGLEPPEPMMRTLEALATLPPGGTLIQLNVRVPQFLLPKLQERGFTWEVHEQSTDLVRLFIRHAPP